MAGRVKVYLDGPERFLVNGRAIDLQKEALCAAYGFECLWLDESIHKAVPSEVCMGYPKCLSLMLRANCGIFNLTPVKGTAPESGMIFRLGMMSAIGKPVYAYLNQEQDILEQSADLLDLVDNSIIASYFAVQNRAVIRTAVAAKSRFSDLSGFESCLAIANRDFVETTDDSRVAVGFV